MPEICRNERIQTKRFINDWESGMAYIKERGAYWRAEVRRKGYKPTYRTFDTQKQAQQWARRVESEMDSGLYIDRTEAERTTLREALERYQRDIVPTKRHPYQETCRINRWLQHDLCYRTLANLKGADFAVYRDKRREAGRAENTIRLELQLISHLYEIARKEWGMENLANPLKNIRKPSGNVMQPSSGPVLDTTANAVICIWKRVLAKLEIKDLRWHDLRHEAASRLFEKGLHPMEVASITGHKSMQMLKRYTHLKPESLLERLG
jgi:site-specific recombinase XerD